MKQLWIGGENWSTNRGEEFKSSIKSNAVKHTFRARNAVAVMNFSLGKIFRKGRERKKKYLTNLLVGNKCGMCLI